MKPKKGIIKETLYLAIGILFWIWILFGWLICCMSGKLFTPLFFIYIISVCVVIASPMASKKEDVKDEG